MKIGSLDSELYFRTKPSCPAQGRDTTKHENRYRLGQASNPIFELNYCWGHLWWIFDNQLSPFKQPDGPIINLIGF